MMSPLLGNRDIDGMFSLRDYVCPSFCPNLFLIIYSKIVNTNEIKTSKRKTKEIGIGLNDPELIEIFNRSDELLVT